MRRAIIVISGWTEERIEKTGSRKLWEKLIYFQKTGPHDDTIFVELLEWNYNWKEWAEWLNTLNVSECFVCAYSWGAGFGLREFSKRFHGAIKAVLCDPVFRSKFPWMRWKAIVKFLDKLPVNLRPTVKLPKNVTVVKWFYQELDQPGNDNVESPNPLPKRTRLSVPHTQIDNHPAYHDACIAEITKFVNS